MTLVTKMCGHRAKLCPPLRFIVTQLIQKIHTYDKKDAKAGLLDSVFTN